MKISNQSIIKATISVVIVMVFLLQSLYSQEKAEYKLQNPITTDYLKKNLKKQSPRLILTPEIEKGIKLKLKSDPQINNYYQYLKKEADSILEKLLLKRELEGFRLLFVSRELAERLGILSMVYRIEKDPKILERIDAEIKAVCNFENWNPQHFLDGVRWVIDPGNLVLLERKFIKESNQSVLIEDRFETNDSTKTIT